MFRRCNRGDVMRQILRSVFKLFRGVTNLRNYGPRKLQNLWNPRNLTKITYFDRNIYFEHIFSDDVSKQLSLVINLWIYSWIKPFFRCHNLWRTGRHPYLTYLRSRRFSFLGWDTLSPGCRITCGAIMLLRKLLLRSQTAINSDPSVSRRIIYTTENFWHGSDKHIPGT